LVKQLEVVKALRIHGAVSDGLGSDAWEFKVRRMPERMREFKPKPKPHPGLKVEYETEHRMTVEESQRTVALFNRIDADTNGMVPRSRIMYCHGVDSKGYMKHLQADEQGMVGLEHLCSLFFAIKYNRGAMAFKCFLKHLEISVQSIDKARGEMQVPNPNPSPTPLHL